MLGLVRSRRRCQRASMSDRSNHYEAAFEAYLRSGMCRTWRSTRQRRSLMWRRVAQEPRFHRLTRRAAELAGRRQRARRFPSGEQKQYWKNWSTRDDLHSLARWEKLLGRAVRRAVRVCL